MFDRPDGPTGVGINYKAQIRDDILKYVDHLDLIEITTEKLFIKDDDPVVHRLIEELPVSLHGLDMSLGTSSGLNAKYVDNLREVLARYPHLWFSDHLSLTEEAGVEVGHLMPVCFSEETLERVVGKIGAVKHLTGKPFLVENITYYYPIPGATIPEAEFLSRIVTQADCGLLLDVNNLYINAVNHRFDPIDFLRGLPLDRVVEIHLAGGSHKFGILVDTHANGVWDEVWSLFDQVCAMTRPSAVIVERDGNFPDYRIMMDELDVARDILASHGLCKRPIRRHAV